MGHCTQVPTSWDSVPKLSAKQEKLVYKSFPMKIKTLFLTEGQNLKNKLQSFSGTSQIFSQSRTAFLPTVIGTANIMWQNVRLCVIDKILFSQWTQFTVALVEENLKRRISKRYLNSFIKMPICEYRIGFRASFFFVNTVNKDQFFENVGSERWKVSS